MMIILIVNNYDKNNDHKLIIAMYNINHNYKILIGRPIQSPFRHR